jgi:hypothetical protein
VVCSQDLQGRTKNMKQVGNMLVNEKFFSEKTMNSLQESFEKRNEVESVDNFMVVMIAEGITETIERSTL